MTAARELEELETRIRNMPRAFLLMILLAGSSTTALAQMSGNIELTLARAGEQWKGEAKITLTGQQLLSSARDMKVINNEIEFTINVLEAELRFSGTLTGDSLRGTIKGFQGGVSSATGTWSVTRQGTGTTAEPLAGNWLGPFNLEPNGKSGVQYQGSNLGFDPTVGRPAYSQRHPKVLFDEAHNNADTSLGRYKPFSDLITSDGFNVAPNKESFSKKTLARYELLVIVNASGLGARRDASAFTQQECDAVRDWVSGGGALLLITDHAPFSSAASDLSKRFSIDLTKGYTIDTSNYNKEAEDQSELVFTRDDGLLADHAITRGRDATERINRIITFTGTSVKGPAGAVSFLKLSDTAIDVFPFDYKPTPQGDAAPDPKRVSAGGRAQGVALEFGKGRVVVLGEAAMLTAQVAQRGFRFGMNVPNFDNRQLALNIMHWLSGLLK
jgi:hypothetical protein